MTEDADEDWKPPPQVHETWWGAAGVGLFFLVVAAIEFRELGQLEDGTRKIVMLPALQGLLYDIGGKWAAIFILVPPGLAALAVATRRLMTVSRPTHC